MSSSEKLELLKGTLDMLILQIVAPAPLHGHAIVQAIHDRSRERLLVDHGSLYPALHRLAAKGWIEGSWGVSGNNRKARFYKLTRAGARQLAAETAEWRRLVEAVGFILEPAGS